MQSNRPLFVVPMSFLATLSLPAGCVWADTLTGLADTNHGDTHNAAADGTEATPAHHEETP